MVLPRFTRDEDKYEINLMKWLRMVKEYGLSTLREIIYFYGESWE
jgi:hypothetical protein